MRRAPASTDTVLDQGKARVRVWDLPTRLFHWLLVAAVAVAFLTGFVAPEWWMGLHKWSGYGVVALIVFRLVWGMFGSEHSRLASLARASSRAGDHLRGLLLLRPRHDLGHTPLGALMIFSLALALIALTTTGLMVLGGEEKQGPLAGVVPYAIGHAAKQVHELLAWLLLGLIAGHILGVVIESALTRENLVAAMVTGWKALPAGALPPAARPARAWPAVLTMAGLIAGTGALLIYLGRLPPIGSRSLAENATYLKECGACHYAFHPSLLPAESWRRVMSGLIDHFGEDASLDGQTIEAITAWLVANAAETWDTEAANRFRNVDPRDPLRVTATPFWRDKHNRVPDQLFALKVVRSKANCSACHGDAATGRFDDQAIALPEEARAR